MGGRAVRMAGRTLARFLRARDGATSIEYAMIAVGIGVAVAATVFGVGTALKQNFYEKVSASIPSS